MISLKLLRLPISEEAFGQKQHLLQELDNVMLTESKYIWRFTWGTNFSSSQAYKYLVGHHQVHNVYRWLWKCLCQPKHKVFFWLLLKDRLSTRNILRRKYKALETYNCEIFSFQVEEIVEHLFWHCPSLNSVGAFWV